MAELTIENMVVSTTIADSLDLPQMAKDMPSAKYNPEEAPAVILHLDHPRSVIMFFTNGNMVFSGPKSIDEIDELLQVLSVKLRIIGISMVPEQLELKIENIVASTHYHKPLNLEKIANVLQQAEYNPTQFPGLIYKLNDPNVVILLFGSGKIICNGTESEEMSNAVDEMAQELSSLGVLS
jgi:transcription initiation factor TFIID TATA-box-binding protein